MFEISSSCGRRVLVPRFPVWKEELRPVPIAGMTFEEIEFTLVLASLTPNFGSPFFGLLAGGLA